MPDPIVWLVLLLPVAAASGWLARARAERDPHRFPPSSSVSSDYLNGITHLVNDDADRAIETFSRAVALDDDTIETHLALGNLFRRQGELDRALRVHQNLIARPQLTDAQRSQARFELGCDYLRAGVLDRAETLFGELVDDPDHGRTSLRHLLRIHEQTREWQNAIDTAHRLGDRTTQSVADQIAQYHCEQAYEAYQADDFDRAQAQLVRAEQVDPDCGRAGLMRGRWHLDAERYDEAIRAYRRVLIQDRTLTAEIIGPVIEAHKGIEDLAGLLRFFDQMLAREGRPAAHIGRARALEALGRGDEAIAQLSRFLQREANWLVFHALLEYSAHHARTRLTGPLDSLRQALGHIIDHAPTHHCGQCGFTSRYLHWQCPNCRHWNMIRPLEDIGPTRPV